MTVLRVYLFRLTMRPAEKNINIVDIHRCFPREKIDSFMGFINLTCNQLSVK